MKGGSQTPVVVIATSDLVENGGRYKLVGDAIRVYGMNEAGSSSIAGGPLLPVYVVDAADVGTKYKPDGGKPMQVVELVTPGRKVAGRIATPVYVVPESPNDLVP